MSYVSVYENNTPKTKGFALAIGAHAVIIAAVMAMPGVSFPEKPFNVIRATNIPLAKPLKPTVEEQKPEIEVPSSNSLPTPPKPVESLPPAPDFSRNFGENDNVIFGGGAGSGIEIEIEPLPAVEITPDPVIVEARLNNRYARQFQPAYPSGQLRREEEGVVSVRVLVGTDGRAKQVELIDSPHPDFWEATRRHALKKWRFTPGTKDGKLFETWIMLKVRFEING
ncbi:energy transducer TonB [Parasphingorhabdus sp.]|uniref:energy transducer TonB n=1 Tax=Parasphingorhabdus sp. TaxID=2709688 RepID=UPI0007F3E66A|nr:hypothetical protein A8B75_08020 [Sphingomonadales bacterium EhC05]